MTMQPNVTHSHSSFQKYLTVFWKFRQLRLMSLFEYRANFVFWSIISVMWTVFNYFFFDVIIRVNGGLAGWSTPQMYILLSTFTLLDAFTWSLFYANMSMYTESIFSGEMTLHLTRPINTQSNSYNNFGRLLIGLVILIVSLQKLGAPVSIWQILGYILFLILAFLFIYSLWFIIATGAFYVEKLDNINEVIPASRRMWQIPRQLYSGATSVVLSVILPLGIVGSIPSEILVGKSSAEWLLYFAVFTLVLFGTSIWFFRYSIRKYSGTAN